MFDIGGLEQLQQSLAGWVEDALQRTEIKRDPVWSESVAVGNPEFLESFRRSAPDTRHRSIEGEEDQFSLRENPPTYDANSDRENSHLGGENRRNWETLIVYSMRYAGLTPSDASARHNSSGAVYLNSPAQKNTI